MVPGLPDAGPARRAPSAAFCPTLAMSTFQPPESAHAVPDCELCREAGGTLVFQSPCWRVIRAADADFPAFYRVVWRAHAREWSDLSLVEQAALMGVVTA